MSLFFDDDDLDDAMPEPFQFPTSIDMDITPELEAQLEREAALEAASAKSRTQTHTQQASKSPAKGGENFDNLMGELFGDDADTPENEQEKTKKSRLEALSKKMNKVLGGGVSDDDKDAPGLKDGVDDGGSKKKEGAGKDATGKKAKLPRKISTRPKLDIERLLKPDGLMKLKKDADKFKFKGKHHEMWRDAVLDEAKRKAMGIIDDFDAVNEANEAANPADANDANMDLEDQVSAEELAFQRSRGMQRLEELQRESERRQREEEEEAIRMAEQEEETRLMDEMEAERVGGPSRLVEDGGSSYSSSKSVAGAPKSTGGNEVGGMVGGMPSAEELMAFFADDQDIEL
ncbi:hypothetical protein HDV05_005762 [Chytridiales sp. JEL 0842]|nr:hypothetical protein HDV05_005762 [Chytridiales sp. JEL 0842]